MEQDVEQVTSETAVNLPEMGADPDLARLIDLVERMGGPDEGPP